VIAVALSVLDFVRRATRPHDAIEGRIRGRHGFFDTERYPDAATEPGFVLYRFDAPLFYANTERFFQRARELVDLTPDVEWFVLDTATMSDIDATAARTLAELHDELANRGVRLVLVELLHDLERLLERAGLIEMVGRDHVFDTAE
jgi:SulP family sulfate permease